MQGVKHLLRGKKKRVWGDRNGLRGEMGASNHSTSLDDLHVLPLK
jgi:hypothetical protein